MEDIMKERKYVLGLDLGVASIGWAALLLDEYDMPKRIIDQNVMIFKAVDNDKGKIYNQERRKNRGARRRTRRRKERLRMIRNHIIQIGLTSKEDMEHMYQCKGQAQGKNVFELKIYGLKHNLNNIELVKVLIHYAKFRGFKSNRKIDKASEEGKMKVAIGEVKTIMKRDNVYVSEAIHTLKKEKHLDTYHNQSESYNYGFERSDVEKEIRALLDKQKEYHKLSDDWIEKYIELWGNQRDFSEGPAEGSPYHVDFENFFGFCKFFPNERRVARGTPSYEVFILLDKLHNLRYFKYDEEGNKILEGRRIKKYHLTTVEIDSLYKLAIRTKTIKYTDVLKVLKENETTVGFVDLPEMSSKDFNKEIINYKEKHSIEGDERLSQEQYKEVQGIVYKKRLTAKVYELKSYKELTAQLKKLNASLLFSREDLDKIVTVLAYAQTDIAITNKIESLYDGVFSDEQKDIIKALQLKQKGSGNLSLKLIYKLIPEMLAGKEYTEAMAKFGFDHSLLEKSSDIDFGNRFPTVKDIEEKFNTTITNPNVKHILAMLRKLYNKLIDEYGVPKFIHVEIARDVKNSFNERNKIRRDQTNNQIANQQAKIELSKIVDSNYLRNKRYHNFSRDDLIKYRLWKEQNGICMYTGKSIAKADLLTSAEYEVDHILPFSRTFDDGYVNKVLVIKKTNQEKLNQTPYEWLHKKKDGSWEVFKNRVEENTNISKRKKSNFLQVEDIKLDEMTAQSLHATSYASKLVVQIFKALLKTEDTTNRVKSFKGGMTSYLRNYYQLNGLTHSLESKNYKRSDTKYTVKTLVVKSNKKDESSIVISAKNPYDVEIQYEMKVNYSEKFGFYNQFHEDLYQLITRNADEFTNFCEEKQVMRSSLHDIDDQDVFSEVGKATELYSQVLFELLTGLKSNINEKNRDNHFHHVVDAILVATMTISMQQKITNFHKYRQLLLNGETEIVDDNGKMHSFESLKKVYTIDSNLAKNPKYQIPLPYPKFIEELTYRVFERDEKILQEGLDTLPQYKGVDTTSIKVKYPKFEVDKKVRGALHAETVLGIRNNGQDKIAVKRESVKNLDLKKLEKLYDKDEGQNEVYKTLKVWIKNGKKDYPKQKNGNLIKKVRLIQGSEKLVKISPEDNQKGYAQIGSVARIEIYKKDNDDKLYFVQIPIDVYLKRKQGENDLVVTVWWGRNKNNVRIPYSQLTANYTLSVILYPGQPIHLLMKTGASVIANVVGFSSGKVEISSCTGDGLDLINSNVLTKVRKQYQLTISTISSINYVKISTLGELR